MIRNTACSGKIYSLWIVGMRTEELGNIFRFSRDRSVTMAADRMVDFDVFHFGLTLPGTNRINRRISIALIW